MERSETVSKTLSVTQMTTIGLMTAITCVLGPIALPIPVSPVPISLTNLVLFFTVYILGTKCSLISYVIYLLLGLVGLPVFSGFTGGVAKLAGPTGGYLAGFLFLVLIAGFFVERFPGKLPFHALGMALGMAVCYLFGTVWLAFQLHIDFMAGLGIGVLPYLPGDAAKILLAVIVGPTVQKAVRRGMKR